MSQLKGPVHKEMVYFHKQKNRNKVAYVNRKNPKNGDGGVIKGHGGSVSRHTKLKHQVNNKHANEDLYGQVSKLIKTFDQQGEAV